jgi:hypothetical protein
MIKSRCYSDDHTVKVDFDATPWFEKEFLNKSKHLVCRGILYPVRLIFSQKGWHNAFI